MGPLSALPSLLRAGNLHSPSRSRGFGEGGFVLRALGVRCSTLLASGIVGSDVTLDLLGVASCTSLGIGRPFRHHGCMREDSGRGGMSTLKRRSAVLDDR